jgi:glycine/D-amino acid oxidase-like deaminating enzyme
VQNLQPATSKLNTKIWKLSDLADVEVRHGTRVSPKKNHEGRLPIVAHLRDDIYIYTGLGSRGLIYHGVFAKKLSEMLLLHQQQKK